MRGVFGIDPDWGVTIVRLSTGIIFAVHGYMKFAGGLGGVVAYFAKIGIPAPGVMAPFIAVLELVGGILLILGAFSRWIALLLLCEMLVTTFYVQIPSRGWSGSDLDRGLLASAILLCLGGPGRLAIDKLWLEKETRATRVRAA